LQVTGARHGLKTLVESMGVNTIWVDRFDDVPDLIKQFVGTSKKGLFAPVSRRRKRFTIHGSRFNQFRHILDGEICQRLAQDVDQIAARCVYGINQFEANLTFWRQSGVCCAIIASSLKFDRPER